MSGWKKEFEQFAGSGESEAAPASLSRTVLDRIRAGLNPSPWAVFGKLASIHLIVGALTLSACPQFGVRLFGTGEGLSAYFMRLGMYGCMVCCGAFFIGSSLVVASLLLRPEEVRVLRRHELLQIGAVTLLSLGLLLMAHAEIVVGFGAAWLVGSLGGGTAMLELVSLGRLGGRLERP